MNSEPIAPSPTRRRAGVRPVVIGAVIAVAAGMAAIAWTPASATSPAPLAPAASLPHVAYGWGLNNQAEIGDGTRQSSSGNPNGKYLPSPLVDQIADVTQIATGSSFGVGLRPDGTVWTWGEEIYGELGDGVANQVRWTPAQIPGLTGVVEIAASSRSGYAVRSDGSVWAWGENTRGQLGSSDLSPHPTPARVLALPAVSHISVGDGFAVALQANGQVWSWGYNLLGQLGDRTTTSRTTPARAATPYGITQIAAGDQHVVALRNDGSVWAWGFGSSGALGDGQTQLNATPKGLRGLPVMTQVAAGLLNSMALAADGTVWSWGYNANGQVGDGSTIDRLRPVHLGLTGVTHLDGGPHTSLAVRTDGTLWVWGDNTFGQLGNGTGSATIDALVPVKVAGLSGVTFAAADWLTVHVVAGPPTIVPDVIGDADAAAIATLTSAGLVSQVVTQLDDPSCSNLNKVIFEAPAGGTKVLPGSSVILIVAVAPIGGCS